MYNFKELKDVVGYFTQHFGDEDYKTNIVEPAINLSLQFLYHSYDHWLGLKGTHNFTTVDGTQTYYMPSDFGKPLRWYDITNDKKITIKGEEEYFDANIANIADANESDADTAYPIEEVGVQVQVATTGDTVQVKSSSASDTSVICRVEGYVDSSLTILGFENITVTGTTAVSGTVTFYKITHFSKAKDSVGYITLENSSGTDLAVLSDIERISRIQAWNLGQIPDDSTTDHRVKYKKRFRKLVNDYDYSFVDADDFLIYNSASLCFEQDKESVERAAKMQQRAVDALQALMRDQNTKLGPDYVHKIITSFSQAHRS